MTKDGDETLAHSIGGPPRENTLLLLTPKEAELHPEKPQEQARGRIHSVGSNSSPKQGENPQYMTLI